ncbi:hypothetical protein TAL182_PE00006 (plasmid) [Rhizobium sp. TAL182]|nr:hypothetical protein TAL182_PE00006 [Rhizobium sp. TAL182]
MERLLAEASRVSRIYRADFPAVGFEREDALAAGEIRAALTAKGKPIGSYEVLNRASQEPRSGSRHQQCRGIPPRGWPARRGWTVAR